MFCAAASPCSAASAVLSRTAVVLSHAAVVSRTAVVLSDAAVVSRTAVVLSDSAVVSRTAVVLSDAAVVSDLEFDWALRSTSTLTLTLNRLIGLSGVPWGSGAD